MNVDLNYDELKYISSEMARNSWQSSLAKTIEEKCRLAMPKAKEQEDSKAKASKIAALKRELAELEGSP